MLQGVARHRILAWAAIAHGVLNVLLSVLFVKLGLGLTGVALGTVLPGVAIHYFWTPNAACRLVGEKRRVYWSRQIRTTLVAAAALALPALCAWKFAAPSYPVLAALAAASAAFYAAFVYRAGLDANERAWIRKTLREKFNRIKSE